VLSSTLVQTHACGHFEQVSLHALHTKIIAVWLDEERRSFSLYQGISIALQSASGLLTDLLTPVYRQTEAQINTYIVEINILSAGYPFHMV